MVTVTDEAGRHDVSELASEQFNTGCPRAASPSLRGDGVSAWVAIVAALLPLLLFAGVLLVVLG
ncbi:MAG TPA: hypothetical protein VGR06_01575 [Actinophytocola sp.]|jgi:hypothetical protein|uniref:hypothetical protein n=1 Tax=Actinophytocola sp. TaxID=1872138 RepID=UPI002E03F82C|nr:hypothetical protein [Actinophytocola sp.]